MQRLLFDRLIEWKNKKDRKPLILKGVRQCGKTYLLNEFGRLHYKDVGYFNFEGNDALRERFEQDLNVERIITELGVFNKKALIPGQTLIIFDEIQFCNKALTALKYFCENAPQYHIACAGSLLGLTLSKPLSFPVGKVDLFTLRPMSFYEFVLASKEEMLIDYLKDYSTKEAIPEIFANKLENYLRTYYITGGMPEVVAKWISTKDVSAVEEVQERIINSYELDFAKHAPTSDVPKLLQIWKSVPNQLAKENSKFIFSQVKQGARAKDLEDALQWLISAGMAHKVSKIEKPFLTLDAYAEHTFFKLYMSDIGLLRKMSKMPAEAIFKKSESYKEFKGALTENYVLTELINAQNDVPYYWKSKNLAEVDFVSQFGMHIVPFEVKSERNARSKSLAQYRKTYKPEISVKLSMKNFSDGEVKNIPLYMLWKINEYIR
jgi:predicted AAA+ superfamily ATPase